MEYKKKIMSVDLEKFSITTLGKLIYNTSVNFNIPLRDELLQVFISKATDELTALDYHFSIMQQDSDSVVPCLLISSYVEDVVDVLRVFHILREYFGLYGNLRVTDNPYYINDKGEPDYFERGNNKLTLLLDFTEYKCNSIYEEFI